MWALGLLMNPRALAALGVLVALGMAWAHGYRTADRACEAAALRAELARVRADMAIAAAAEVAAEAARERLERQATQDQERIDAYRMELDARPREAPRCVLSPDDARRLRDIGRGR